MLAFWLDGSRGKSFANAHSDYDCTVVVSDECVAEYRKRFSSFANGLDCRVMSMAGLQAHAAWGSAEAYDRYNFAHLKVLIDRTGEAQRAIDEKACVPADQVRPFISKSLDHVINQIYRALKCLRDGQAMAARLESAEAVNPLLDAMFALNGARLRPYFKYLEWELRTHPLVTSKWSADELIDKLTLLLEEPSSSELAVLIGNLEELFRPKGFGDVFDAWGANLGWMKDAPP